MTDDMPTETALSSPSIIEAHCQEVGKMAVCLFYLSRQARAANLPEIAQIINQSISGVVTMGVQRYHELLRQALAKNSNDESIFIDNFCKVNDETVKFGIQEIFSEKKRSFHEKA